MAEAAPASRRTTMTPEASALASDPANLALARRLAARRALNAGVDPDALESAAVLGLVQAAMTFDPSRGVRFSTHATNRIRGEMADEMRRLRFGGRHHGELKVHSIDAPAAADDPRPATIKGWLADESPPVGRESESGETIEAILGMLPDRHRDTLRAIYLDASGYTLKSAGRLLGVCGVRAMQIRDEALDLIRERNLVLRATEWRPRPIGRHERETTMAVTDSDPRIAEILRRQAEKAGAATAPDPEPEPPAATRAKAGSRKARGPGKSGLRGVCWNTSTKKFQAQVHTPTGNVYAGSSLDKDEAGRMHDRKARELLGDAAVLNFPDEYPPAPPPVATMGEPQPGEEWLHRDGEPTLNCTVRVLGLKAPGIFKTTVLDGNYAGAPWNVLREHLIPKGDRAEAASAAPAKVLEEPVERVEEASGPDEPEAIDTPVEQPPEAAIEAEAVAVVASAIDELAAVLDPREPEPVATLAPRPIAAHVPQPDPEIAALASVVSAMSKLTASQCRRVLAFASDRFVGGTSR